MYIIVSLSRTILRLLLVIEVPGGKQDELLLGPVGIDLMPVGVQALVVIPDAVAPKLSGFVAQCRHVLGASLDDSEGALFFRLLQLLLLQLLVAAGRVAVLTLFRRRHELLRVDLVVAQTQDVPDDE